VNYGRRATDRKGTIVITQRSLFIGVALLLTAVLIGLVFVLFRTMQDVGLAGAVEQVAGIQSIYVLDGPGVGENPLFDAPMGVAVGREKRIYVADAGNNRICVFSAKGKFLFDFGGFGVAKPLPDGRRSWSPGLMNYPTGIDCDEQGNVFVADFKNDQIQVFDPDGNFLRRFPDPSLPVGKGSSGQDGTGIAVTDLAVRNGKVFATDRYQVFVFTTEGEYITQFGRPGAGEGDLDHPNGITVTDGGVVYVADSNHARVSAFSADGKHIWTFGTIPRGPETTQAGPLGLPRGLTVGPDGRVLVADSFHFGLVALDRDGAKMQSYGTRGSTPGTFNFPNDVEVLDQSFVVADKGNDRVQVVKLVESGMQ